MKQHICISAYLFINLSRYYCLEEISIYCSGKQVEKFFLLRWKQVRNVFICLFFLLALFYIGDGYDEVIN